MSLVEEFEALKKAWPPDARALFHRLWTKAVGTPDYDKKEWALLEEMFIKALAGVAQKEEHLPCKQGVAGSTPAAGSSSLDIGKGDAAIIIREDGSLEAAIPTPEDMEEEIRGSAKTIGMLMFALSDPTSMAVLQTLFDKKLGEG